MNVDQVLSGFAQESALAGQRLSWLAFVRKTLDPLIAGTALVVIAALIGEPFDRPYVAVCALVFALMFPRNPHSLYHGRGMFRKVLLEWSMVVALLVFLGLVTNSLWWFYPPVLLTWFVTVPFLIFGAHLALLAVAPRLLGANGYRRAVIAGASQLGRAVAAQFAAKPILGIKVAGFFDDRSAGRLGQLDEGDLLGRLDDLPGYVGEHGIGAIFIALPMASQPRILKLLDEIGNTTASVYFVPDVLMYDMIQARIDHVGGMPLVAVCESPFVGVNGLIKRLEDIVLSALFLVLSAPLMLAIAVGVKLSSPGPVLFKQRRYGLDGKQIIVYKFRTMRVMEDGAQVAQAQKNDPRVTRFGAWLRRTSLDELPQFVNVLQGRMSVVGPRPHAVAHNELYRRLIKRYMIRHKVRPGITGLAQVNGCRGETEVVEKMHARVEYDIKYIREWSLTLDLAIVLKTVFVLFGDNKAY
ncbi:MAG: undecaprenyl-phosphate glucose phosphotransferase [Burkholderiales bacterium]|nr:undecaprenyl-phosphate glucose phosphotransferase [Burkholderiales bacterium]